MGILKVSAHSNATATAGALANTIRQQGQAELQGIGPKAVNQAVKAIAIARSYLASSGVDLVSLPDFVDVEIDGQPRTAVRFLVKPRHLLVKGDQGAKTPTEMTEMAAPPRESASLGDALSGKSIADLSEETP